MGELARESPPTQSEWTLATEGMELTISRSGGVLTVTVGMPPGGAAEEPEYTIELAASTARQVADRLTSMSFDAQRETRRG